MKSEVYPLPIPSELYERVRKAAKESGLSMADIMRRSLKAGFPVVSAELGVERVTNVEPLPEQVASKLYSEPDDDEEGIRRFMAAQAKSIQE